MDFKVGSTPSFLQPLVTKTYLSGFFELLENAYGAKILGLPPRHVVEGCLLNLVEAIKTGAQYYWTPTTLLAQKSTSISQ